MVVLKLMITKYDKTNRSIFDKIHLKQNKDKSIRKKVINLINTKDLNLEKNYFHKKVCADFGCGSNGFGSLNLLNLNAEFVHLVDLEDNIVNNINSNLTKYKNKYSIHINSIEKTNLKSKSIDFILCQGVLHHVKNDIKALREMHRVLKKNGKLFLSVAGDGGVLTEILTKVIRPKYFKDSNFKKIVDKIMFDKSKEYKKFYYNALDEEAKILFKFISKYIDQDLLLSFRDRISPNKVKLYDEKKLKKLLRQMKFKKIYRIKRDVKYNNIRKLLVPFYHHYDNDLSKFLYGNGVIHLMMQKG